MSPLYLQHWCIFIFAMSRNADYAVNISVASVVRKLKFAATTRQPFSIISTSDKFPFSSFPCGLTWRVLKASIQFLTIHTYWWVATLRPLSIYVGHQTFRKALGSCGLQHPVLYYHLVAKYDDETKSRNRSFECVTAPFWLGCGNMAGEKSWEENA